MDVYGGGGAGRIGQTQPTVGQSSREEEEDRDERQVGRETT